MLLKILQVGDPVLRQVARPLSPQEILSDRIQQLVELMRATMHDAEGVGLAAPQVGEPVQLAVIEDRADFSGLTPEILAERDRRPVPFHVIINPTFAVEGEEGAAFFESCLSVSGFLGLVRRALRVRVEAINEKAESVAIEARGWYARILQHEIDHLNGTLYLDQMEVRTFSTSANYARFWRGKPVEEVRRLLRLDELAPAHKNATP